MIADPQRTVGSLPYLLPSSNGRHCLLTTMCIHDKIYFSQLHLPFKHTPLSIFQTSKATPSESWLPNPAASKPAKIPLLHFKIPSTYLKFNKAPIQNPYHKSTQFNTLAQHLPFLCYILITKNNSIPTNPFPSPFRHNRPDSPTPLVKRQKNRPNLQTTSNHPMIHSPETQTANYFNLPTWLFQPKSPNKPLNKHPPKSQSHLV